MVRLLDIDRDMADGTDNAVELLHHDVAQQDGAGALLLLDTRIVRKVDRHQLDAGVGMSGQVDGVTGEHVRLGTGREGLVRIGAGQHLLERGEHGAELVQHGGTFEVLEKDVGIIGRLQAEETVVGHLARADHQVHLAVSHVQPGVLALIVIITAERIALLEQVGTDGGLDRNVCSRLQAVADLVDLGGESLVIRHGNQFTVRSAADQGVRTVLGRILETDELIRRHVGRIEVRAEGHGAEALDERNAGQAVPRAIVDCGIGLEVGVGERIDRVPVTEKLLPVNAVSLVCCELVEIENFLAVVGDTRQVRRTHLYEGILIGFFLDGRPGLRLAGPYEDDHCNRQENLFHM